MEFSINDWKYAGEGKVRIALSNRNKESSFYGNVLLIRKIQQGSYSSTSEDDVKFIDSAIKKWYTNNYISDELRSVSLSDDAVHEIINMVDQFRPITRIKKEDSLQFCRNVIIQRNFSVLHRHIPVPQSSYKDDLTLELKIKCGLRATTPFVCDSHSRLKLGMSRFHLMQLYKHIRKGENVEWGQFSSISTYDPIDIVSRDPHQIQLALSSLFSNPQNNLRASLNSEHIYGWEKRDAFALAQSMRNSDFNECFDSGCPIELVHALAAALAEESLLDRLSSMQRLDILDSEGAHAVFLRLQSLAMSEHTALQLLKEQMFLPLDVRILSLVDPDANSTNEGIDDSDECISIVRKLVALNVSAMDSESMQQVRLEHARVLVGGASSSQCLFLLQMWMLAVIAKDASVIITARRISLRSLDITGKQIGDMWVSKQSVHNCGTVCSMEPVNGQFQGYVYSLGLIDVGLKSFDKIWKRAMEDSNVCRVVWNNIHRCS